jgi:hypothetical protein
MAYQVVVPRRQQDGTIVTVTFNIGVKDPLNAIPKAKAHNPGEDFIWEDGVVIERRGAAFHGRQRLDYSPKLSLTATASSCSEPR